MDRQNNIIKDILQSTSALGVYQKRTETDEQCELVFFNKEINEWNKILTEVLGPAVKPANVAPTKEHLKLTSPFGGITNKQTLFKKEHNSTHVIAMLWPWGDNEHTTLKIAYQK